MFNGLFDPSAAVVILAVMQIIAFLLILMVWIGSTRQKKKISKMFIGTKIENVEELIHFHQSEIKLLKESKRKLELELESIQRILDKIKGNVGVIRYNAFSQIGSDLSYSVAIIDNEKTGLVLSGIHGREQSYTYAKPLVKGESEYPLSPEEREAIRKAAEKK